MTEKIDTLGLELGFTKQQQQLLAQAIDNNINTPLTTSAGRLFDVVAALIGLCYHNSFEGEAAMALEYSAIDNNHDGQYDIDIYCELDTNVAIAEYNKEDHKTPINKRAAENAKKSIVDWRPMIQQILKEYQQNIRPGIISARFHNTLAAVITTVAKQQPHQRVMLTGGCFQNKLLLEKTIAALRAADFEPYWHHQIPPNDGGLAAGQIVALLRAINKQEIS
jgi:hydrogenase maturation protein HypF